MDGQISASSVGARRVRRRPRVFLGLSDLCGYYSQLERGLRERGFDTVFVNAYPEKRYARSTTPDAFGRILEWAGRRRVAARRGSPQRWLWMGAQGLGLFFYGVGALARFDVFIFASGQSFLLGRDRRLLRLFGKRVIAVCHGTDARPPYMNGALIDVNQPPDSAELSAMTRRIKRFVRRLEATTDVIVNHPLVGHFHEHPFVDWRRIGIPTADRPSLRPNGKRDVESGETVIVHAPTRPGPKGTAEIEAAIERLKARGYKIRFLKIVERPNDEVLEALQDCDFVVDELYSDTTMAGFASEAAFFGKPAIIGSYGIESLKEKEQRTPVSFLCYPSEIEAAIETLLCDVELRERIGAAARAVVTGDWSASRVAEKFANLIEGDIPTDWWFDPHEVTHVHGWGLPVSRLREVLRTFVDTAGPDALELRDKPALARRLLDLAAE